MLCTALLAATTIVVSASVDRIEDDLAVLDVPPHPSLAVPRALAPSLGEGDAVLLRVRVDERGTVTVTAVGDTMLVLESRALHFRWPRALAPGDVAPGDRLSVRITEDPLETRRREAALEALRRSLQESP